MQKVFSIAKKLAEVPNAPFFPSAIKQCLLEEFAQLKMYQNNETEVNGVSDNLGCYLRIKRGNTDHQTVLIAHIDHPAIIFKNGHTGQAIGNTISNGVRRLHNNQDLQIKLFNPDGTYLGNEKTHFEQNLFSIISNRKLLPNTIGIWDIPNFQLEDEILSMRACDNLISVAILLSVAHEIVQDKKPYDVIFIFPYIEEILQLSMVGISLKNSIPVAEFNKNMVFITIDIAEIRATNKKILHLLSELDIDIPDREKGLIIQVSDTDMTFGALSGTGPNLSESVLVEAATKNDIPFQISICEGKSDSLPLSLFTSYPNIVSLLIPCSNSHNIDMNSSLSPEIVRTADILAAQQLISKAINISTSDIPFQPNISQKLKEFQQIDKNKIRNMSKLLHRAYKTNSIRLKRQFFYTRNGVDLLNLALGKIIKFD
jgi:hypothetical protein